MRTDPRVPFLSKRAIEHEAQTLLASFERDQPTAIMLPVPAEDILEFHLGLTLGFGDLKTMLGLPDPLGALWVGSCEVLVDESLDPATDSTREGRYLYTVGHEMGHWCLHRSYLLEQSHEDVRASAESSRPSVVCRTTGAFSRIELQANYFASCLLIPRATVMDSWQARFGEPQRFSSGSARRELLDELGLVLEERDKRTVPHGLVAELVAGQLAPLFGVSRQAMRIRLEDVCLLRSDGVRSPTYRRTACGADYGECG